MPTRNAGWFGRAAACTTPAVPVAAVAESPATAAPISRCEVSGDAIHGSRTTAADPVEAARDSDAGATAAVPLGVPAVAPGHDHEVWIAPRPAPLGARWGWTWSRRAATGPSRGLGQVRVLPVYICNLACACILLDTYMVFTLLEPEVDVTPESFSSCVHPHWLTTLSFHCVE